MITNKYIPPSKRAMLKKRQMLETVLNMRAALPVLDRNTLRRCRMSHYEAILEELRELGYINSYQFLQDLIEFQEEFRKAYGPESLVHSRPQLMYSVKDIDILYNSLKIAESAHFQGNISKEIDEFTTLGIYYGFGSSDWWWLGKQIFTQALSLSEDYVKDDGKRRAVIKYLYGKFLMENMNNGSEAQKYLNSARQLSVGRVWTVYNMGQKQDGVFTECCKLLYKALIIEGKLISTTDPFQAQKLFTTAEKRAVDVCDTCRQVDALLLQGLIKIDTGDASSAVHIFLKALTLSKRPDLKEKWCEASIHLALAYSKVGLPDEALAQLKELLELAESNDLAYYVAQANRFIGEFYLNEGIPNMSTPFLIKAFQNFFILNDVINREHAKNLAAISAGQELMPKYIEVLLISDWEKGFDNVIKLKNWKDRREIFWSESQQNLCSPFDTDNEKSITNLIDNKDPIKIIENGIIENKDKLETQEVEIYDDIQDNDDLE